MRLTIHPDGAVEVERDQREGTPVVLADEAADIVRALVRKADLYPRAFADACREWADAEAPAGPRLRLGPRDLDMTAHGRKLKVRPRVPPAVHVSRTSLAAAHRRCLDAYGPDDVATREFAAMLDALPADGDMYTLALTSTEKR